VLCNYAIMWIMLMNINLHKYFMCNLFFYTYVFLYPCILINMHIIEFYEFFYNPTINVMILRFYLPYRLCVNSRFWLPCIYCCPHIWKQTHEYYPYANRYMLPFQEERFFFFIRSPTCCSVQHLQGVFGLKI